MSVEFWEWPGLRITFFAGASEPVWLMAEIARPAGNVPKTARRLGVRVYKLRTVLDYVQANARRIGFERETTIEAGFVPPEPVEIFPSLIFPADPLLWRKPELPLVHETNSRPRYRRRSRELPAFRD